MAPLPLREMELGGYWTDGAYQQISAQGEAQRETFTKHIGKSGHIWLVPTHGRAEQMIVSAGPESNPHGNEGYGGAKLTFHLDDDTTFELKGPWSSNADALFEDTGIDLRNKFQTWGCIGRHRGWHPSMYDTRTVICDLVYFDPEGGLIGPYNRIRDLTAQMALERDEILFCSYKTYDGGSSVPVLPYEGTEDYKLYRKDSKAWLKLHPEYKAQMHYWQQFETTYWEKYHAEFGNSREWYKLNLKDEPLDDSEYEPEPPEPVIIDEDDYGYEEYSDVY